MKLNSIKNVLLIARFILCVLLLSTVIPVSAEQMQQEDVTAMPYRYRVKKNKSVKIRTLPNVETGERIRSANILFYTYILKA